MGRKWHLPKINWGQEDLRKMWSIQSFRLSLLGILVIPLVYSSIYLAAFYDPYKHVEELSVAIVNEDQGATVDGRKINLGDQLVSELKKNKHMKWTFMNRNKMEQSFLSGNYYLGVVIPRSFSKRAVSVSTSSPEQSEILYYIDQSQNYLAGSLGKTMIRELEAQISHAMTQLYVKTIFQQIRRSTHQLNQAAKGAKTLAEKGKQASNAALKLKNGTNQLIVGNQKLQAGLMQLTSGVNRLQTATRLLSNGASQVVFGTELVVSKVRQFQQLIHEMKSQIQIDQVPTAIEKLNQIENDSAQAGSYIQFIKDRYPFLQMDENFTDLQQVVTRIEVRGKRLKDHMIKDRINQLKERLQFQLQQLDKLNQGAKKVAIGLLQLNQKVGEMLQGVKSLNNGQQQLGVGLTKLQKGLTQLYAGLGQLANGEHKLATELEKGVKQAKKELDHEQEKEKLISNPIKVNQKQVHQVPNYATGFAPYFISLSLWVGAMLLFTVTDLFHISDTLDGRPIHFLSVSWIAIAQAVICVSFLHGVLNIKPKLPVWFYIFSMITAITFVVINQLLTVWWGNVGRFLSIVILMLQLASSGGTYPIELLPKFFQNIHPWLPMSYTVHGFRMLLSNGDIHLFTPDLVKVLIFLVSAALLLEGSERFLKPWWNKRTP
ncbi:putative membrane protein [Seinonella peptonophila]|uniref:Putative membrane protein n=1 Tax=Seinonella peptonophila TaxID=112248 RepID=A0A1M4U3X5_9BACL|nr:YhgE/Pip domain-containing protein [Seinonella peptonophila]SHE51439.1 putative membrane protein [Seinonella peptonophila]